MRGTNGRFRSSFHRAVCRTTRNHRSMSKRHRLLSYDPRGVSKAPILVMAVAATILLWLVSSVASIDPVKSLSTWARTAAILGLGVMLTAFLSQSKRRVDLALKSLTISSFGLLLFYAVFSLYIHPAPFELFCLIKGPNAIVLQTLKPYFSVSACILPIVVWAGFRLGSFHKWIALFSIPLTFLLIYGKGSNPVYQPHLGSSPAFFWLSFFSASNSCRHIWPARWYSSSFARRPLAESI